MAKEELITLEGLVTELLPDARFRVQLDTGHTIVAYTAGRMKKHRIKTLAGDRVTVEMSPYDLEKGRLVFRHKDRAPRPPTPNGAKAPPRRPTSAAAELRAGARRAQRFSNKIYRTPQPLARIAGDVQIGRSHATIRKEVIQCLIVICRGHGIRGPGFSPLTESAPLEAAALVASFDHGPTMEGPPHGRPFGIQGNARGNARP